MQTDLNAAAERVVGRFYKVPCVSAAVVRGIRTYRSMWPVLGSWHEDRDFIGFDDFHYHVDLRFATRRQLWILGNIPQAAALHDHPPEWGGKVSRPVLRWRKCKRTMPLFPIEGLGGEYPFPALAKHYLSAQLGPHRQCPHKGLSLADIEPVCGVLVCPLHGLCFDAASGKAIPPSEAAKRLVGHGNRLRAPQHHLIDEPAHA